MYPHFKIGGHEFSTYWMIFLVGIILIFGINCFRGKKQKKKTGTVFAMTLFFILVSLAGAKILYYLENISVLMTRGIRLNGVSFFGAVFLAPLGGLLATKITGEKWRDLMDFYTPSLVLMLAVLRVGCYVSGCCGGISVTLGGIYISVFPAQLTECAGDLLILAGLLLYEKYWDRTGRLYPFFMVYYGCLRFLLEFVRDTSKNLLGMSHGQWFSVIAVIIGGWLLHRFGKNDKKEEIYRKKKNKKRKR